MDSTKDCTVVAEADSKSEVTGKKDESEVTVTVLETNMKQTEESGNAENHPSSISTAIAATSKKEESVENKPSEEHVLSSSSKTDGCNNEGCNSSEKDEITLGEMAKMVQEDEEWESAADALLGPADDEKCSYDKGYVKRQPLYACITCAKRKGESGGVCYACSLKCHDRHELVELYTKRLFRCDCGNDKFSSSCKLVTGKDLVNSENKYNQNFNGLYCSCARPYPDLDGTDAVAQDEMIQCSFCEDWFHSMHLSDDGKKISSETVHSWNEMVCKQCAAELPFIRLYQRSDIPVEQGDDNNKCKLPESFNSQDCGEKKMIVCDDQWRSKLCRCQICMKMYSDKKCSFLLDNEDRVSAYESQGNSEGSAEAGSSQGRTHKRDLALSKAMSEVMDPHTQRKMILGFNEMSDKFSEFLGQFKDCQRAVSPGDIQDFFATLKRQRMNDDRM